MHSAATPASFSAATVFGRGQDFHFVVVLRVPEGLAIDEALVRTIIDQERPAFCTYDLSIIPMQTHPPSI